jgi:hypothetical protein
MLGEKVVDWTENKASKDRPEEESATTVSNAERVNWMEIIEVER